MLVIRVRVLDRMTGNPDHSSFGRICGGERHRRHRTSCLMLSVQVLMITSVADLTIPAGSCKKSKAW